MLSHPEIFLHMLGHGIRYQLAGELILPERFLVIKRGSNLKDIADSNLECYIIFQVNSISILT